MTPALNLRSPALLATAVVAPFVVLEMVTRVGDTNRAVEARYWLGVSVLFALMWLIVFGFVLVFRVVVRDVSYGGFIAAHPLRFGLRVGLLLTLMGAFAAIVFDQMPCLLGVPICD